MIDRLLRWMWDNTPQPIQRRVPWPLYRRLDDAADRADEADRFSYPPSESLPWT